MIVAVALALFTQTPPLNALPPDFVPDPVVWERPPVVTARSIDGEAQVGFDCAVGPDRRVTDCQVVYKTGARGTIAAIRASTRGARLVDREWPDRVRFSVWVREAPSRSW